MAFVCEVGVHLCGSTDGDYGFAAPGSGPVFLEKLQCEGDESSLFKCQRSSTHEPSTCHHSQDVGIMCKGIKLQITFRE